MASQEPVMPENPQGNSTHRAVPTYDPSQVGTLMNDTLEPIVTRLGLDKPLPPNTPTYPDTGESLTNQHGETNEYIPPERMIATMSSKESIEQAMGLV